MSLIWKALLLIRATGISTVWKIFRYTWLKRNLDKPFNQKQNLTFRGPGNLRNVTPGEQGLTADFDNATLSIRFLDDDLVKISWSNEDQIISSLIQENNLPPIQVQVEWHNDGWQATSHGMKVHLQRDGSLKFVNPFGKLVRFALPPEFQANSNIRNTYDSSGWRDTAESQPGEHYFGLGIHTGSLELSGGSYELWNTDPGGSYGPGDDPIYMPLPVYLSLSHNGGYLQFYANSHRSRVVFPPSQDQSIKKITSFQSDGGAYNYYVIVGNPSNIIKRFTALIGRSDIPPLWSLGYHHSRWGYKTEHDIRELAEGFVKNNLPLSAVHLDIDYQNGYRIFTINDDRFPNLKQLADDLLKNNIHLVTIIDPGIKEDPLYSLYTESVDKGLLVSLKESKPLRGVVWGGTTAFPDFSSQDTRKWWGEQYKYLLDQGISGFWHDMNEPSAFSLDDDKSLPLAAWHKYEGKGALHHQVHNLYGFLMNRAGYEGLKEFDPESRPWIVSRSGWVGNQRYAWNWTADIELTWDGLRLSISQLLNLGLSGQPFSGSDIGGFSGNPDAELYTRWFQAATFMPFFRTHSSLLSKSREPWRFDPDTFRRLKNYLRLRERLLPYFYTLAWQANQTGWPLARPLFWNDPEITELHTIADAFLLGDAMLVAPVLAPGCRERKILLPPGNWTSFRDGRTWQGSKTITVPVDIEAIPVLIRQGTIIPLQDEDQLKLHYYCFKGFDSEDTSQSKFSTQVSGHLFRDSGDGYEASRVDLYRVVENPKIIEIICQSRGEYSPPNELYGVELHGKTPMRAWSDGRVLSIDGNCILTGEFNTLQIEVTV